MVTPRALGVLLLVLLLLLGSDQKNPTSILESSEQSRNVCLGLVNMDLYQTFYLTNTAKCFTKCRQSKDKSCDLGNLQRYWVDYETHLVEESLTETVDLSFLKTSVKNFSTNISEDVHFSLTPSQLPMQVTEDEHKPADRVRLPRSLFTTLQGSRAAVRLAISVLDIGPGNLFKGPQLGLEDSGSVLNNRLVGLSLGRMRVTGLAEPLEITFSHQPQPPVTSTGPNRSISDLAMGVHGAMPVAIPQTLVYDTAPTPNKVSMTCQLAALLGPVSWLGAPGETATISQGWLLTSQVRFYWQRFKSEDSPKIHVALSISLFLLNLTFFINMGHDSKESHATCWAQGAIFHYFLLCVFTWMVLEAFHLYLLVIRVFNTYFSHYFLKLSLVGWGLPALMVIGTGSANSYGRYTIRDKENRTSLELCWFQEETAISALYVTVHGYFLLTFLFSTVVLGLVAWKIFTLSSATAGKKERQNWKGALTLLGLSSLVGMTWGLAILTPLGLSTVYIFALFNSLQGVFIFCWFVMLYFPIQTAVSSSSGPAQAEHSHTVSHE
ncbi:adhesion G protein-coupled receptor G3 [Pteropus vampyrus]|uniref:Adhesion G protein-coupled receptor G3 n=1 Tax=Pteropus vampyrus TaxID=132908 RepID=A0A6P6CG60_PTEVA|nr:adhesion G protein-coupled receptor G3 [Pteropus vampyrus]